MNVSIYVEGGGDHNIQLREECRRGFSTFIRKAGFEHRMPKIVPCGGRRQTFDRFCTALRGAGPDEFVILLVDSEDPIRPDHQGHPWLHLCHRLGDHFIRPPAATDDHAHLMVPCMEAWFLADRGTLAAYFGQGFHPDSLPNPAHDLESVPKDEIMRTLGKACSNCKVKDKQHYRKGVHSFAILVRINPDLVRAASPHARRFLGLLEAKLKP